MSATTTTNATPDDSGLFVRVRPPDNRRPASGTRHGGRPSLGSTRRLVAPPSPLSPSHHLLTKPMAALTDATNTDATSSPSSLAFGGATHKNPRTTLKRRSTAAVLKRPSTPSGQFPTPSSASYSRSINGDAENDAPSPLPPPSPVRASPRKRSLPSSIASGSSSSSSSSSSSYSSAMNRRWSSGRSWRSSPRSDATDSNPTTVTPRTSPRTPSTTTTTTGPASVSTDSVDDLKRQVAVLKEKEAAHATTKRQADRLAAQVSMLEKELQSAVLESRSKTSISEGLNRAEQRHRAVSQGFSDRWEHSERERKKLSNEVIAQQDTIKSLEAKLEAVGAKLHQQQRLRLDSLSSSPCGLMSGDQADAAQLRRKVSFLQGEVRRYKQTDGDGGSELRARVVELEAQLKQHQVMLRHSGNSGTGAQLDKVQAALSRAEVARERALAELRQVREAHTRELAQSRAMWEARLADIKDKAFKIAEVEVKTKIVSLEQALDAARSCATTQESTERDLKAELDKLTAGGRQWQEVCNGKDRELAALKDQLVRANTSADSSKKREKELKDTANKYRQRALALRADAAGHEAALRQANDATAAAVSKAEDLAAQLKTAAARADALEEAGASAQTRLADAQTAWKAERADLRTEIETLTGELDVYKAKAADLRSQLSSEQDAKAAVAALTAERDAAAAARARVQAARDKDGADHAIAVSGWKDKVTSLEAEKKSLKAWNQKLTQERDAYRVKATNATNAASAARDESEQLQARLDSSASKTNAASRVASAHVTSAVAQAQKKADEAMAAKIEQHHTEVSALRRQLKDLKAAEKQLAKRAVSKSTAYDELVSTNAKLQAMVDRLAADLDKAAGSRKQAVKEARASVAAMFRQQVKTVMNGLVAVIQTEARCRDGIGNLNCLIKEAKLTEMRKDADAIKVEYKAMKEMLSVMQMSVTAAEEKIATTDVETAVKSRDSRREQVDAIKRKAKDARKSSDGYTSASVVNVGHLQDVLPKRKQELAAAVDERTQLLAKLDGMVAV